MTSKGSPFQTALLPPPRNVGTPDSAETPAPVKTTKRSAFANRSRSFAEINGRVNTCMLKPRMVAKHSNTSQFRDPASIQYNSRLLLFPLPFGVYRERVRERASGGC